MLRPSHANEDASVSTVGGEGELIRLFGVLNTRTSRAVHHCLNDPLVSSSRL